MTPLVVPTDSTWYHAYFTLSSSEFTPIGSPGIGFNSMLSNFTGQLRILSAVNPSIEGDSITATMGVDNIRAIPEPNTLALTIFGVLMLWKWSLRNRK